LKIEYAVSAEQQKLLEKIGRGLCNQLKQSATGYQKQAMVKELADRLVIQTQQFISETVCKSEEDSTQKFCDCNDRQSTEFQRIVKNKVTDSQRVQELLYKIEIGKLTTMFLNILNAVVAGTTS
jgi:ribosomal protein L17